MCLHAPKFRAPKRHEGRKETGNPQSPQCLSGGSELGGHRAQNFVFLFFPSTFQTSPQQGPTTQNRAMKLVLTLLAEIRKNNQKQHGHKNQVGKEKGMRLPQNLPPSTSPVPQFPPSNAGIPRDFWPCMTPQLADGQNNHSPQEYVRNLPKTLACSKVGTTGTPRSAPLPLHSRSLQLGFAKKCQNCRVHPPR